MGRRSKSGRAAALGRVGSPGEGSCGDVSYGASGSVGKGSLRALPEMRVTRALAGKLALAGNGGEGVEAGSCEVLDCLPVGGNPASFDLLEGGEESWPRLPSSGGRSGAGDVVMPAVGGKPVGGDVGRFEGDLVLGGGDLGPAVGGLAGAAVVDVRVGVAGGGEQEVGVSGGRQDSRLVVEKLAGVGVGLERDSPLGPAVLVAAGVAAAEGVAEGGGGELLGGAPAGCGRSMAAEGAAPAAGGEV